MAETATTISAPPAIAGQTAGIFYGQLSALLKAGMPLPNALRALAEESGTVTFRTALERAAAAIDSGKSPGEAFGAEEQALGGMLGRVAAASAQAGRFPLLLAELSSWTLIQNRIRNQI